jgi:TfoX/Sxy family transcriptional regulator of competence genes
MKPTQALAARFAAVLADYPEADCRSMFGCPCAWVGTQMFSGVHSSGWFVRLPEPAREEVLALPGAAAFTPGRDVTFREYVVLPAAVVEDDEALAGWLERSLAYAASLPPKPERPPRRRAPKA